MGLPFITVIIPALNEEQFIRNTLDQLVAQCYPPSLLEILVVDGGSVDATREIVEERIKTSAILMKLLHNPRRLSSSARNIAVGEARGEYVLFIDAHVHIPDENLLFNMAVCARKSDAQVLGRAQPLNPPGIHGLQGFVAKARTSKLGHSSESYIYSSHEGWVSPLSVAVMYRRSIFEEFGLFDENFDAAEDVEFNFRLEKKGLRAYMSPDFRVYYYPRKTVRALFLQMYRYGLGRAKFIRKHPERFTWELFIPCLAVGTAFTAILGLLFWFPLAGGAFLMTILFFVALAILTASSDNPEWLASIMVILCLATIHLGLATGLVLGFAKRGNVLPTLEKVQ